MTIRLHRGMPAALLSAALLVGGCSTSSDNIAPAYVSPLHYESFDCDQIGQEMARVGRRVSEVAGVQDSEADGDAVAMGVGLVLFWPALFFLADGGDREAELARLKGEYEAIERAAIQKNCETVLARMEEARAAAKQREAAARQAAEDEASVRSPN